MINRTKAVFQYLFWLALAAALVWLSLRTLQTDGGENRAEFIWQTWLRSDKFYLVLMALIGVVSHVLRAWRWKMLVDTTGNPVTVGGSFLAVLIGYLVNLAIPRGGELSRCYYLYKLDGAPAEVSFGTVVLERIVDVICLLAVMLIAFWLEWSHLQRFIQSLGLFEQSSSFTIPWWLWLVLAGIVALGFAFYFIRKNARFQKLWVGFRSGLLSVFQLKNKALFVGQSLVIWALYFAMSYCVILAFPETAHLGFRAVISLFAIGAIAMSAPLPGGTGSYHTLVPLGLVMLYNLPKADAIAFVFIFHAWQTLTIIASGVVALIVSYFILQWRERHSKSETGRAPASK
ncbi:MAG: lysylphosphatidylglycerol synthase transmembrane domain-containing protein [Cyclobacteriaceae bacterium]|jgi:uncharacterized protein (TIRG00374 family)